MYRLPANVQRGARQHSLSQRTPDPPRPAALPPASLLRIEADLFIYSAPIGP